MPIAIYDHQDSVKVDVEWLREIAQRALPLCAANPGRGPTLLGSLGEIEVSLLDDDAIADVNEVYLAHSGPTDVITFDHGEILIGVGAARENAESYGKTLKEELVLYIIHGLLHLNGWEDKDPGEANAMTSLQERILVESTR